MKPQNPAQIGNHPSKGVSYVVRCNDREGHRIRYLQEAPVSSCWSTSGMPGLVLTPGLSLQPSKLFSFPGGSQQYWELKAQSNRRSFVRL
jgi:hypothetical protein